MYSRLTMRVVHTPRPTHMGSVITSVALGQAILRDPVKFHSANATNPFLHTILATEEAVILSFPEVTSSLFRDRRR